MLGLERGRDRGWGLKASHMGLRLFTLLLGLKLCTFSSHSGLAANFVWPWAGHFRSPSLHLKTVPVSGQMKCLG